MKTTSNRQQHLLGDCQYLQKDDETKLALSKFMEQLRALDYDILLDLQT
jgi:ADP-heptose:LPS heptosyltransferase